MGAIVDLFRQEWYPAWDSGDPERLERASRRVFAADARLFPSGVDTAPLSVPEALPMWLNKLRDWRNQVHEIVHEVECGREAAWEYRWHATYEGPIGGRAPHAEGSRPVFRNTAFVMVRADETGKIVSLRGASNFHDVLLELESREDKPPAGIDA